MMKKKICDMLFNRYILLSLIILTLFSFSVKAQEKPLFFKLSVTGKRVTIDFKLSKIEAQNKQLLSNGGQTIEYEVFDKSFPNGQKGIEIIFSNITPESFDIINSLYGGHSRIKPKEGRQSYSLVDFLPPAIQALEGKGFRYRDEPIERVDSNGNNTKLRTSLCQVCWGAAYGISYSSQSSGSAGSIDYPIFNTGRFEMSRTLQTYGTVVAEGQLSNIHINENIKLGDLILFYTDVTLYDKVSRFANGLVADKIGPQKAQVLQHVAVHIDQGLVFEKVGGEKSDPYRLVTLEKSASPYTSGGIYNSEGLRLQFLSFENGLPPAEQVFGTTYPPFNQAPTKVDLAFKDLVTVGSELFFPSTETFENYYRVSYVELKPNRKGRFAISAIKDDGERSSLVCTKLLN